MAFRYHNVYGMLMVMATREGIAAANTDKRPFVLSRGQLHRGQRYAATWTGDNTASWPHLKMSIPMVLNVGLSGQPFIGPDRGRLQRQWRGRLRRPRQTLCPAGSALRDVPPSAAGNTGKETSTRSPGPSGRRSRPPAAKPLEPPVPNCFPTTTRSITKLAFEVARGAPHTFRPTRRTHLSVPLTTHSCSARTC